MMGYGCGKRWDTVAGKYLELFIFFRLIPVWFLWETAGTSGGNPENFRTEYCYRVPGISRVSLRDPARTSRPPRTMIPDAVFRPETRRKRPVSGRNLRENGRNLLQKFHDRIRLPELIGTGRKWQEFYRKRSPYPYGKTASGNQREFRGSGRFRAYRHDLGWLWAISAH